MREGDAEASALFQFDRAGRIVSATVASAAGSPAAAQRGAGSLAAGRSSSGNEAASGGGGGDDTGGAAASTVTWCYRQYQQRGGVLVPTELEACRSEPSWRLGSAAEPQSFLHLDLTEVTGKRQRWAGEGGGGGGSWLGGWVGHGGTVLPERHAPASPAAGPGHAPCPPQPCPPVHPLQLGLPWRCCPQVRQPPPLLGQQPCFEAAHSSAPRRELQLARPPFYQTPLSFARHCRDNTLALFSACPALPSPASV